MLRYECPGCHHVFFGWAIKYKYKNRCPDCGDELREIYDDNQKFRRDPIAKLSKTRKNLRNGNL